MRRILVLTSFGLCLAGAILYATEYASVHLAHDPFGSVVVTRYYLIPQKNGKTEIVFQPAQPQQCVHSLFAHEGYLPCWYLSRHPEQAIKM